MNTDNVFREAFHLLDQHASNLAEILDGLDSPFEEEHEQSSDGFRDYPTSLTWWNSHIYRI